MIDWMDYAWLHQQQSELERQAMLEKWRKIYSPKAGRVEQEESGAKQPARKEMRQPARASR